MDLALLHDVLHHVDERLAYLKAVATYLKPGGRVAVIEFEPSESPHKNDPALVVSKQQAGALMATAGFELDQEVQLFTDKWFVIYRRR